MKLITVLYLFISLAFGSIAYGQSPVANFSADGTSGCSPFKVNFFDQSTGNPVSWHWDLGNGTISTKKDPSGVYISPGTYQVKLTITNTNGGNSSKTGSITVYENPKAKFTPDKKIGCAPLAVQFTDQSEAGNSSSNTKWMWDFGNGVQSTLQNPSVKYTGTGIFPVVLKVTNDKGCINIITQDKLIQVNQGISLSFTNTEATVCTPPFDISFSNNSTGSGTLNYTWQFGNGTTSIDKNPSTTYLNEGVFSVALIGTNNTGCTDTLKKQITIGETNTDFKMSDTICVNAPINFTNTSSPSPVKALWEFSDGSSETSINASKLFAAPGTYTVKLSNTYSGCVGTKEKTIVVEEGPKAFFSASVLGKCSPDLKVDFENLSTNAFRYQWNFGDSSAPVITSAKNVSHNYTKNGIFRVSLTAFNNEGCSNTYILPDSIIIGLPTISITGVPSEGCLPLTIKPVAQVKPASNIISYEWNFGEGTKKTDKEPSHIFTTPGKYDIRVLVKTSDGCSVTDTIKISVGEHSTLAFTAAPRNVCAIDPVVFNNQSLPPGISYNWYFGDGGKSQEMNPSYPYNDTGWFQVKLESNNNGCVDSVLSEEKYIYIKAPIARFSYKPNCEIEYQYQFIDESLFDPESVGKRTWKWIFPDGTESTNQVPPIYTFPAPGEYLISLTVSNGNCTHVKNQTVRILNRAASVSFDTYQNCKPIGLSFQAISDNLPNVASFRWEISGFDTATTASDFKHFFYRAGNYDVKLTTTDKFGCIDSTRKPVLISGSQAAFTRANLDDCTKLTATFTDASTTFGTNKIISWNWDFGDGEVIKKTDATPVIHTYKQSGEYNVKLSITDAAGCTDSQASPDQILIKELRADWTATEKACLGFPITFKNNSSGDVTSAVWNFGDGSPVISNDEGTHIYKDTGYFDLKLVIQDAKGCKDSLLREGHTRIAQPLASFSVKDSISFCPPLDVAFNNTSDFYGNVVWTIGDETSNEINHRKLFTQPGKYDVSLLVESPDSKCTASASKTILINRSEDALMKYDPLQACLPGLVNLSAFDNLAAARFYWDFGDGNILDTAANIITHTYTDLGSFTPKIILTEDNGCVVTIAGVKPILIKGVKTKFEVSNNFFCDSGSVQILDSTTNNEPISKYTWNFGDGTISNLPKPPAHQFSKPGTYSINLIVETVSGCIDSTRLKTPVTLATSPRISIAGDSVVCVNEHLHHTGILEQPDSTVRWLWEFPNGKKFSVQKPAIQQYTQSGAFQINAVAVNNSGCADTATKSIRVNPIPRIILPAVISTSVGNKVLLPAKYSSNMKSYLWTPDSTLSCNNCPQPTASPRFNTKYKVAVIDSNGCKNQSEVQVMVLCQGVTVFLPNTFSPNGDGSNDIFYVRGKGLDRVISLRIFNRWGEIVFEQKDFPVNSISHGWDGKMKGQKPQPDVYVYQAEVYCGNGDVINFSGNVALIQ